MNSRTQISAIICGISIFCLAGCSLQPARITRVPAVEYADRIKQEYARRNPQYRAQLLQEQGFQSSGQPQLSLPAAGMEGRAGLRMISESEIADPLAGRTADPAAPGMRLEPASASDQVTNLDDGMGGAGYQVYESRRPQLRDYTGPLSLGDPGVSASLWKESSAGTQLFRDYRAWQPMDLITIVVTENSEGKNKADTDIKQESTVRAFFTNLFGWEKVIGENAKNVDLNNLIGGGSQHDYKGEGETTREGSLKGTISAMVAEVLPTGVLRVEGEKIITVNNDDQIMKISGLVRPEDVSSRNEVDSSKVANVRIDYFGKGSVGDAQTGGWLGNIVRKFWPL